MYASTRATIHKDTKTYQHVWVSMRMIKYTNKSVTVCACVCVCVRTHLSEDVYDYAS